jgi:chromosome segregation ATPase
MESKAAKSMVLLLSMVLLSMFFLLAAGPVLAQEEQQEQQVNGDETEIPPELVEKLKELRAEMKELRETLSPLTEGVREYVRENRASGEWERGQLKENISHRREKIQGLEEQLAPLKIVFEAISPVREAIRADLAAAKGAWDEGDLASTLSYLDQAITKIEELTPVLQEMLRAD